MEKNACVSFSDIQFEYENNKKIEKVRIFMNSRGCRYAKRKQCIMCSIFNMANDFLSVEEIVKSFKTQFDKYTFEKHPMLAVYTPGSFLDDWEIPKEAKIQILEIINAEKNIKRVLFETRPEFVTKKKIKWIVRLLEGQKVSVAIGLESSSDYVRNKCINKSFKWEDYLRAAGIIKEYCELRTYVLFKPPFLTEREALNDAVSSIKAAFSAGSDVVSLEICNVQKNSPLEALYDLGLYKPPTLWSIINVLSQFKEKKVYVGGVNDYPSSKAEAFGCDECTEKIKRELLQYNSTLNLRALMDIDCKCKNRLID